MNDLIPSPQGTVKDFWSRTEGTTGMITLGALGLAGFFVAQAVLPILLAFLGTAIAVVGKTIVLAVLCAVLAAFLAIVTNKKFLTLCSVSFKVAMRRITNVFVTIFPIEIMKEYIDDTKEKKLVIDENKKKLSAQMRICKEQIEKNASKVNESLTTAKVAMTQGKQNVFQLNANIAGRLEKSNMTRQDLLNRMTLMYRALTKYSEAADFVIADLTSEVQVREEERDMMLASYGAMQAAQDIINGSGDKKELFDNAMEFVVEDYGRKMGEIEDFMNSSQGFIDGLDLQNGVFAEQALKQMEAWESKADSILLGGEKRLMIESAQTSNTSFNNITQPAVIDVDYTKYFSK